MSGLRLGPFMRCALHAPTSLYDRGMGWIFGRRFLCLAHVGRKSGTVHKTILEVIGEDEDAREVIVMAGFGRSSQWYRNLQANEAVEVAIGRERFKPAHRELSVDEAAAVLASYEERNRWVSPIVKRVLSKLVGWRYDGGDQARRRLVGELPVIAFRPGGSAES